MRSFGPVPRTRARSTPNSRASRRTAGLACARPEPACSLGAAGRVEAYAAKSGLAKTNAFAALLSLGLEVSEEREGIPGSRVDEVLRREMFEGEAFAVRADKQVGAALAQAKATTPVEDDEVLSYGLALGKQYELQRRILSPESVSKALFSNALALARNRGLLRTDLPDLVERRRGFAAEVADAIRRVDAVDALVAARNAGLIE